MKSSSPFPHQMSEGDDGVVPEHAWTGVAHDLAHELAHCGFVAMDGTMLAGRFVVAKLAMV